MKPRQSKQRVRVGASEREREMDGINTGSKQRRQRAQILKSNQKILQEHA